VGGGCGRTTDALPVAEEATRVRWSRLVPRLCAAGALPPGHPAGSSRAARRSRASRPLAQRAGCHGATLAPAPRFALPRISPPAAQRCWALVCSRAQCAGRREHRVTAGDWARRAMEYSSPSRRQKSGPVSIRQVSQRIGEKPSSIRAGRAFRAPHEAGVWAGELRRALRFARPTHTSPLKPSGVAQTFRPLRPTRTQRGAAEGLRKHMRPLLRVQAAGARLTVYCPAFPCHDVGRRSPGGGRCRRGAGLWQNLTFAPSPRRARSRNTKFRRADHPPIGPNLLRTRRPCTRRRRLALNCAHGGRALLGASRGGRPSGAHELPCGRFGSRCAGRTLYARAPPVQKSCARQPTPPNFCEIPGATCKANV
jgi:hypothetical protein